MVISWMRAMRASNSSTIAFTGSGGKTTTLFQLARELSTTLPVVLVTASTHLGAWQIPLADKQLVFHSAEDLHTLEADLAGVILITRELEGDRTKPLDADTLSRLHGFCTPRSIPLLVEADGSRQKPLKAWAEHEPPIPAFVRQVVLVTGLAGIGKPLRDETVHRSEIFSRLSDLGAGETITPAAITKVLLHPEGGQKNIPAGARKIALLNLADTPDLQSAARGMVPALLQGFDSVIIASVEKHEVFAVHEPTAGIILAAGESSRFGQPKQLLDWKGQPFVRAVAKTALEAGLDPVLIVTGANRESVETTVRNLSIRVVHNEDWTTGQSSSIRKAVNVLNADHNVGSAIFLLVDQPQVTQSILQALVEKHAQGLYPVVAPMVIDRRANPVLFACCSTWIRLNNINA
jgi:molybdenum cofactor cytidylyltransferase